jgi:hypothetical protein
MLLEREPHLGRVVPEQTLRENVMLFPIIFGEGALIELPTPC